MSRRIFFDIEEAISREVRRITFHNPRTADKVVLKDTFDPFTGEIIPASIEPSFYDSSADANNIQYPHFFVRLLKTREDRFSGRETVYWGKYCKSFINTAPKAYEIITSGVDGTITTVGNTLTTSLFQIAKIQPGNYLRLLAGNNVGTYVVSSVIKSNSGNHSIIVSNVILNQLPGILFDLTTRKVYFQGPTDLSTTKVGDIFTDASLATFNITSIDVDKGIISIDGTIAPSLVTNAIITRSGNIFTSTDLTLIRYLILDPSKPIQAATVYGLEDKSTTIGGLSPQIPLDAYYLIRIDSKFRENHIDILNRVWEEFNPPRTGLPIIKRTSLSAEQELTADIPTGGSSIVTVGDTTKFNVGDEIVVINDFHPTKKSDGEGFERPFTSKIVEKISNTQLKLANTLSDEYKISNSSKIVSNTEFKLFMFHFVDHSTKDIEGSQYWIHEFTFWVQLWVDRLEEIEEYTSITDIATSVEGNLIIEDN